MMAFRIPFSGRGHHYSNEEIDAVIEAMQDADPLTQGRYRDAFEKAFSRYMDLEHCFTVNNGTAGLELAAQLCQFEDGDEIVAPSHTFTASVYPFIKHGARVVWADIDLKRRVLTADTVAARITPKTKAVLVVHLYGYCADVPAIIDLAQKHNLLVIEDAAQALGTETEGTKAGAFGDMAIFSFHSHKNMSTLGEGGIIAVKDESMAALIPMIRHNGHCPFNFPRKDYWVPAMGNVDLPELNGKPVLPNNFCLGEAECALGIKMLDRIDSINKEKRNRALRFMDCLRSHPELEFHRVRSRRHNYHLLAARLTNGRRNEFIRRMAEEKQIQCVVQYYPLNRYDFYKKLGLGDAECPNTDLFYDNMVSFPFHHWMTEDDLQYMMEATQDVLSNVY